MTGLLDTAQQRLMGLLNIPMEAQRFATNPQAFLSLLGVNKLPQATGFAAGATGLPAKDIAPGGVLNPPNLAYQRGYEQGEPLSYAAMASPLARPVAKALAPKAYDMLENYMVQTGGLLPLTAYHGTPHTIQGKFDINKVGTGEGNQTFGHGMYFAENPKVAEGYRDALSVDPNFASEKLNFATLEKFAPKESKNVQKMIQMFTDGTANYNDFVRIINQEGSKSFKNALLKEEPNLFSAGNLYKVDIPDEQIPNMLDWDKPLTKDAPQQVKDALNGIIQEYPDLKESFMKAFRENKPGNHYYSLLNDYAKTGDLVKNQQFASDVLQKAGIPGIRYLDEGSRVAGKGTSNFVVFDPSTVNILEKNSEKVEGLLD
jgi:hypothetical protein